MKELENVNCHAGTGDHLIRIASEFVFQGEIVTVRECGSGNVNDTFLVEFDGGGKKHFILQRVNTQVFRRPDLVMMNMRTFSEHVLARLERTILDEGRRWEVIQVLPTHSGQDHWTGTDGSFWRAISFVENSISFDTVQSPEHAKEVGFALGLFHNLVSDLPASRLADTLEGFHITPRVLRRYEEVKTTRPVPLSPEVTYCLRFIEQRRTRAHVLEKVKKQGILHLQPIHGDPKVNNVMMDADTGKAVSLIDLDTVKPGLIHYDIGDCIRSSCNPLGEETESWESVRFEPDLCRSIIQGYLPPAKSFLTEGDLIYFFQAIRLIPFELGLRFFTDYLEGNVYFKARRAEHNLARALVQFKLAESIESQAETIQKIIEDAA